MATTHHQVFGSASVFGPRNQYAVFRPENYRSAEVFARERTSATLSDPGPQRVRVLIPIGGESFELVYCGPSLPLWAHPVLSSLPKRWGSGQAWDSYRAAPTRIHLVVKLLNCLSAIMADEFPTPQITALPDGGVQAEWHGFQGDLEVVVSASESPSFYFFNRITNAEEEAPLDDNEGRVRELVGSIG